jgi:hypothetical protein
MQMRGNFTFGHRHVKRDPRPCHDDMSATVLPSTRRHVLSQNALLLLFAFAASRTGIASDSLQVVYRYILKCCKTIPLIGMAQGYYGTKEQSSLLEQAICRKKEGKDDFLISAISSATSHRI